MRGLFQFNLQSLLLLIVAAAFAFAWWKEHLRYQALVIAQNPPRSSWSIDQVTGPPDTPGAGDIQTAWASSSRDAQAEWLLLEYPRRVVPTSVVVHETYNPGALARVTAFDFWGSEHQLWQGTDPTPTTAPRGVSKVTANASVTTRWIKIYLDSPRVPGWNEIDAVGIIDADGNTHWARTAYGSTAYGDNRDAPRWYRRLGEGE